MNQLGLHPILGIWMTVLSMASAVHAQMWTDSGFQTRKKLAIEKLKIYHNEDTSRVNALGDVFECAVFLKQRQEVMGYANEGLSLSKKLSHLPGIMKAYYFMANYHVAKKSYDSALLYVDSMVNVSGKHEHERYHRFKCLAFRLQGQVYLRLEDYRRALDAFHASLDYFKNVLEENTMYIYRDISNIYSYQDNLDKALEYSQLAAEVSLKLRDTISRISAAIHLSTLYIQKKDLQKSLQAIEPLWSYMPDPKELNLTYAFYRNLGNIAKHQGSISRAYNYLDSALIYAEKSTHAISINEVLFAQSDLLLQDHKVSEAKRKLMRAVALSEKVSNKLDMHTALVLLAKCYAMEGNPSLAYETVKKAMAYKDSILKESIIKHLNALEVNHQNAQKVKTIESLKTDNALKQAKINYQGKLTLLLGILVMSLLSIMFLSFHFYRQRRKLYQQSLEDLEKSKQIHAINAMVQGQEEERKRLAQELHDSLGGMLSGVKLSMINMKEDLIMNPEVQSKFEKALGLMDLSIQELRHVAHNMMPAALVKLGLKDAIQDYCQSVGVTGIPKVQFQITGETRILPDTANINVYRIIQELVNNSIRHAMASYVLVQLHFDATQIEITVEDDGKGFNVLVDAKGGMGLDNVKKRVDYFKGTLDIQSSTLQGTSVYIQLPI